MRDELPGKALVRHVASFGIPGHPEPTPTRVEDGVWGAVRERLVRERVTGLALAASGAGVLRLDEGQRADLVLRHRGEMAWVLAVERKLLDLADAFERARVPFVVLKGSALAHSMYPDPAWRGFIDLDVLVPTNRWREACDALVRLGHRRKLPEPRRGFDERFGKAATHVGSDRIEVDLHRTLALGPFGQWIDPEEVLRHTTPFNVGGRELQRLDDTAMFLHSCIHASLGAYPPLLLPLRDVAQVASGASPDWELLAAWGRRWRVAPVYRHALSEASAAFGLAWPIGSASAVSAGASRNERRVLSTYTSARRQRGATSIATVRAIPGVRGKARYAWSLLAPDRSFLEARAASNGRRPTHAGRLLVPVRWLRHGVSTGIRRREG